MKTKKMKMYNLQNKLVAREEATYAREQEMFYALDVAEALTLADYYPEMAADARYYCDKAHKAIEMARDIQYKYEELWDAAANLLSSGESMYAEKLALEEALASEVSRSEEAVAECERLKNEFEQSARDVTALLEAKEGLDKALLDYIAADMGTPPTEPKATRITIDPCECNECGEQRAEHQKRCHKTKPKENE